MASLDIALLGAFQVTLDDTEVTGFRTDKMRALLAYLCTGAARPHRREALMDLLWPDQSREAAGVSLRQALFKLRQILGDHQEQSIDGPGFLLITPLTVQFNGASDHRVDVAAFSDPSRRRACTITATWLGAQAATSAWNRRPNCTGAALW